MTKCSKEEFKKSFKDCIEMDGIETTVSYFIHDMLLVLTKEINVDVLILNSLETIKETLNDYDVPLETQTKWNASIGVFKDEINKKINKLRF